MCPLVSAKFAQIQRRIGVEPEKDEPIRLVALTLDPVYDTPPVLARYGALFGADRRRWILATGTPKIALELAARLGIASTRTTPGTIVHTEALAIVDGAGRIARILDGNAWTADEALSLAREAAGEATAPWVRIRIWLASGAAALCGARSVGGLTVAQALGLLVGLAGAFAYLGARLFRAWFPA